jgi:molybdopterin-guanine dinucleotide biosynthesis protein A|tara:strand:- start:1738 stop:2346 length:609 start_codon:yes stop_codon:yes gene_type:complete
VNKNLISVILTGGKSSRMNFQNKSFLKLDNKFFIENIIANLEQKVSKIIINANNDIDKYQYLNLEIVRDKISGYKGPLAGLHSAMYNYQNTKEDLWFAILPTDAPIINSDYIDLFKVQDKIKEMAFISKINGSVEPMFSFWSIKSFSYLDQILNNNDGYKIMKFAEEIGFKYLNVSKKSEAEFFNVNNQEDYEILLDLLKIN